MRQRGRLARLTPETSMPERLAIDAEFGRDQTNFLNWLEGEAAKIGTEFPIVMGNPTAYSYFSFPSQHPFEEYVHWERHGESLMASQQRQQAGDIKALERLQRTMTDIWRVLRGKGPLKPFQGDPVHRQLLELIICFEPEASPLTATERADCVVAYCACGGSHDAEALKKQYGRLKKQLLGAREAAERNRDEVK